MMTHSSQKWLESGCWFWRFKCFSTVYKPQQQPCSDSSTDSAPRLCLLWRSYEGHSRACTYMYHPCTHPFTQTHNETKQNKLLVFCSLMVLPALINQDSKKKKKAFRISSGTNNGGKWHWGFHGNCCKLPRGLLWKHMSDLTGMFTVSMATDSVCSLSHCLSVFTGLTFDLLSVSSLQWSGQRNLLSILKNEGKRKADPSDWVYRGLTNTQRVIRNHNQSSELITASIKLWFVNLNGSLALTWGVHTILPLKFAH